jgi:hypothetical protein
VTNIQLSIAAGIVLGIMFTAAPLTVVTFAVLVPVIVLAGRGLPPAERRLLTAILLAAIAVRAVAIGGMVIAGIPYHNDLAIGSMAGDDAYYLSRAIRGRDVLLGITGGKYDYFVVNDEYGRTSYVGFITALQVIFGPTPFSLRLLNAVLFVIGSVLLFRLARPAFGPLPSIIGLVALLFLPSLAWSSISILKESVYFLCSAIFLYCAVTIARDRGLGRRVALIVTAAAMLWLLGDLRRGALLLAGSGLALAVLIRFAAASRTRGALAAAALLVAAAVALSQPSVQERAIVAVESAARLHGGHVFTAGHAYKLLDEGFYLNPAAPAGWPLDLNGAQAGRFLARAAISFVTTPWPWQLRSRGEIALLPEQLVWYLILLGLPAGIVAGWRRDRWTVAVLIGFAVPIAVAVALTNGNVGTLVRLRGLVTPYLLWIGALGLLVMADALAGRRREPVPEMIARPAEGHG